MSQNLNQEGRTVVFLFVKISGIDFIVNVSLGCFLAVAGCTSEKQNWPSWLSIGVFLDFASILCRTCSLRTLDSSGRNATVPPLRRGRTLQTTVQHKRSPNPITLMNRTAKRSSRFDFDFLWVLLLLLLCLNTKLQCVIDPVGVATASWRWWSWRGEPNRFTGTGLTSCGQKGSGSA